MRHLKGAKSPATMKAYGYAVRALDRFLVTEGMPTDPQWITSDHIDQYLDHEARTNSPATAKLRRTFLSVFFTWLVDEGECKVHPVRRAKVPDVTESDPDVLRDDDWDALLATCKGNTLDDRRDLALLRMLESSGLRRSECAALKVGDVDLGSPTIGRPPSVTMVGKGNRRRTAPIDDDTVKALDRYFRKRPDGGGKLDAPLWMGRTGQALSHDGIAGIVRRRGAQAGIKVHPHQLRHRWAHDLKSRGMSEEELMSLGGWRSREIMARYARSTTAARALASYHELRAKS